MESKAAKLDTITFLKMVLSVVNVGVALLLTLCFIIGPGAGFHGKSLAGAGFVDDFIFPIALYSAGLFVIAGCTVLAWGPFRILRSNIVTMIFAILPSVLAFIGVIALLVYAA